MAKPMLGKFIIAFFLLCMPLLIFTGADLAVTYELRKLPLALQNVCLYITEIGKSEYYLVPSLLLALYYLWSKQRARILCKQSRYARRMFISLYVFACVALGGIVTNIIKLLAGRARPKEFFEHGVYGFEPFATASRYHGFPSGHANTMTALVISLIPFTPARWRVPLVVYAAIVTATRCILSAHYVSDVMGGALVAALVCYVLQRQAAQKGILPKTAESPKLDA